VITPWSRHGTDLDYRRLDPAVRRWWWLLGPQAWVLVELYRLRQSACIGTSSDTATLFYIAFKTGVYMDREHVKGAADKAKGAIKDAAGKVTGDKELQAEGKLDKLKGAAHSAAGDVKDALRDASKDD
jgi:uncharacterized protein YjbJ (UPF0337 family)